MTLWIVLAFVAGLAAGVVIMSLTFAAREGDRATPRGGTWVEPEPSVDQEQETKRWLAERGYDVGQVEPRKAVHPQISPEPNPDDVDDSVDHQGKPPSAGILCDWCGQPKPRVHRQVINREAQVVCCSCLGHGEEAAHPVPEHPEDTHLLVTLADGCTRLDHVGHGCSEDPTLYDYDADDVTPKRSDRFGERGGLSGNPGQGQEPGRYED